MTNRSALSIPVSTADHSVGPRTAAITLVEYGDYQCPYCGAAFGILRHVLADRPDIRFIFRNFPLTAVHPNALRAAEAAEAAASQGKFWEMHDMLYENQSSLDDRHLVAYATAIGLDIPEFDAAMRDQRYRSKIEQDFMGGVRSGVGGTPTFFINGEPYTGDYDRHSFEARLAAVSR